MFTIACLTSALKSVWGSAGRGGVGHSTCVQCVVHANQMGILK